MRRRTSTALGAAAACVLGLVLSTGTAVTAAVAAAATTAPANDRLADVAPLTVADADLGDVYASEQSFDFTAATVDAGERQALTNGCRALTHTGWYRWTAPNAGRLELRSNGGADAAIAVYGSDTPAQPGTVEGCVEGTTVTGGAYGNSGVIYIPISTGRTYWVQYGTVGQHLGPATLSAIFAPIPTNDDFHSATTLDPTYVGTQTYTSSALTSATSQAGEPRPFLGGCAKDLTRTRWWTWTAPTSGLFDLYSYEDNDIQVAAWSGANAPTHEEACSPGTATAITRFETTAGTTYWFQVGTPRTNGWIDAGAYLVAHSKPANDSTAGATQLDFADLFTSRTSALPFDNVLATGTNAPICGKNVSHPLWHSFVASTDSTLAAGGFMTSNGIEPVGFTVLAIYVGSSGPGTQLACSAWDSHNQIDVNPGATARVQLSKGSRYWIMLATTAGQEGVGEGYLRASYRAPVLEQTSNHAQVVLSSRVSPDLKGKVVYFYRRSGLTGQVVPLGTATVDASGLARRIFTAKTGQILAIYSKMTSPANLLNPYSNTVQFKVR